VSAIPLGGYVKLGGDESNAPLEGTSAQDIPPEEMFNLRPRWQRVLVALAGPVMNILTALAIPFAGAMMYGVPATPNPVVYDVRPGGAADKAGLKVGDRIVSFNGAEHPSWDYINGDALLGPGKPMPVIVNRNGVEISLTITPSVRTENGEQAGFLDFVPDYGGLPVVVGQIVAGSPAEETGFQGGDVLVKIGNEDVKSSGQVTEYIRSHTGQIPITVQRNGQTVQLTTPDRRMEGGRLGVGIGEQYPLHAATVGSAFKYAWDTNIQILRLTGKALGQVFTGERSVRNTLSGPIGMWHWPLLVLPAVAVGTALPGPVRLALVGLTFVLAEASRRWVEDPIRHGRAARLRPSRSLALAGLTSLIVAGVSVGTGVLAGPRPTAAAQIGDVTIDLPTPRPTTAAPSDAPSDAPATPSAQPTLAATPAGPVPDDLVPSLATVRGDIPVIYADACHAEWRETAPRDCVYGDSGATTTVVLIGDSHAAHWFPTFQRLADEQDWRLISLTKSACPVADLPVYNSGLKREYVECDDWRAAVVERIAKEQPALVVISDSRTGQFWVDGAAIPAREREDLWATGLARSIRAIEPLADHVVVIGDTPRPGSDVPVCVSDHLDDALACATPVSKAVGGERIATERAVSAETGATFIDPTAWLCPTSPCPAVIGKVLVYRDGHHMTTPFARALAPYLAPLLPNLGG
jgi:RIP metalloprotease RseP